MTQYAEAVGTQIAYDSSGDGPDLVFLHAGIADRTMWQPQIDALADRYRCTTFDSRGRGGSALGDEPFSQRDDVAAVMDAVGASAATLVGCSIGAGLALDFAIEYPQRVEKLVLIGVTPNGFDHEDPTVDDLDAQTEAAVDAGDFDNAANIEVRLWVDGPGRPEGAAPAWLRDKVKEWCLPNYAITDWGQPARLDPPAFERLDELAVPTLVLVGVHDAEYVLAGCRATADGIPTAHLVELDGTAHLPNLEVADEFNTVLAGFLTGLPRED